jgi:two-component system NtrC family sensor kinase
MSGERILIADDRRENLLFLADSVLRPEGYEVITAIDGKQALDKALGERPDLIITDLKMPRMSGLELMAGLRKAEVDIPVILTTFFGSEQTAIQAFRLGARDYIVKPYEVKDMLDSVERALIEQRLRRETMYLQEGAEVTRHLEERVRQLHSLCGIGQALAALHDGDEVMRVVVEASIFLSQADCGQLFLINAQEKRLEIRALRGPSDTRARCVRQPGADNLALKVAQTSRAQMGERQAGAQAKVPRLGVPLRLKDRLIGVLAVDAKADRAFDENDRYQLGILASFASVALTNAWKIERLQKEPAAQPPQASPPREQAAGVPLSILSDSIAEAERLSGDLRNLAAAAQVLAAKLQVHKDSQKVSD